MSENLNEILGSIKIIKINNVEYKISKCDIGDIVDFTEYCTQQKQKEVLNLYKISGEEINYEKITEIQIPDKDIDIYLNTFSGAIYFIYLILRKNNKEITLDKVKKMFSIEDMSIIEDIANYSAPKDKSKKKIRSRQKVQKKIQ